MYDGERTSFKSTLLSESNLKKSSIGDIYSTFINLARIIREIKKCTSGILNIRS